MKYIIEGEWTGYHSGQRRVVHRTVHTDPKLRAWAEKTYAITYTDGTQLILIVRDVTPREKVEEKHGYDSLIRDCFQQHVTSVSALQAVAGDR